MKTKNVKFGKFLLNIAVDAMCFINQYDIDRLLTFWVFLINWIRYYYNSFKSFSNETDQRI